MAAVGPDGGVGNEVVVSVRGEALATVDPDTAMVRVGFTLTADSRSEASIEAGRLLETVASDLAALGGKVRTADTDDHPLTWATTSVSSQPEFNPDPGLGPTGRTGRTIASAQIEVRVRDFDLLPSLQAVLDGHEGLQMHAVGWYVDPENAAWRLVRGEAIHDAIGRGRDYAHALGGELARIEHLADTGLLGGADRASPPRMLAARSAGAGRPATAGSPQPPPLDPLPQVLSAVVEARFIATGIRLEPT